MENEWKIAILYIFACVSNYCSMYNKTLAITQSISLPWISLYRSLERKGSMVRRGVISLTMLLNIPTFTLKSGSAHHIYTSSNNFTFGLSSSPLFTILMYFWHVARAAILFLTCWYSQSSNACKTYAWARYIRLLSQNLRDRQGNHGTANTG